MNVTEGLAAWEGAKLNYWLVCSYWHFHCAWYTFHSCLAHCHVQSLNHGPPTNYPAIPFSAVLPALIYMSTEGLMEDPKCLVMLFPLWAHLDVWLEECAAVLDVWVLLILLLNETSTVSHMSAFPQLSTGPIIRMSCYMFCYCCPCILWILVWNRNSVVWVDFFLPCEMQTCLIWMEEPFFFPCGSACPKVIVLQDRIETIFSVPKYVVVTVLLLGMPGSFSYRGGCWISFVLFSVWVGARWGQGSMWECVYVG